MVHKLFTIVLVLCSANLYCSGQGQEWLNYIDVCLFRDMFMTQEIGVNAYINNPNLSVYELPHHSLGLFTCLVLKNDMQYKTLELELSDEAYRRKIESNACRQYPVRSDRNETFTISTKHEVRVVTYRPMGSSYPMQTITSIKLDGVEQVNKPSVAHFAEARSVIEACTAHAISSAYNRYADCEYENVFKIYKIKIENKLVWCYFQTKRSDDQIGFDLTNNNYNFYETYPELNVIKNIKYNVVLVNAKNTRNYEMPRVVAVHQVNATEKPPAISYVRINSKQICKTPLVEKKINCGRPRLELEQFQTAVYPDQYPWIVFVYARRTGWQLICQGTLIDHETIITGASCATNASGEKLDPTNLRIIRKQYNKTLEPEEDQFLAIREIILSEHYNKQYYEHDIALLKLKSPFTIFRNDTMPICTTNNRELFNDKIGVVTGFGLDRSSKPLTQLSQAQVLRIRSDVCRRRDNYFRVYLHENTYCVDYANSSNICPEMDGSGMFYKVDDVWMLSGIVSIGVATGGRCSLSAISLYTDVTTLHGLIEGNRS